MSKLAASVSVCEQESYEERLDSLFRELELAVRWQRPSILFAVYRSEYVRINAANLLASRLEHEGQQVIFLQAFSQTDLIGYLSSLSNLEHTILFIYHLDGEEANQKTYLTLNRQRDYFLDHPLKIVFWLTESETINLARYAPDYWSLRHRVVEFLEPPSPEQIWCGALESAWQEGNGHASPSLGEIMSTGLVCDQSEVGGIHFLINLGILSWRKGDYAQALSLLSSAQQNAHTQGETRLEAQCAQAIALVQADRGTLEEAIQAYQSALRLAPDEVPLNLLGYLYLRSGDYQKALEIFRLVLKKSPADALSWNDFGEVLLLLDQIEDAMSAYRKAIALNPSLPSAWCGLGNILIRQGKVEEAMDAYRQAVTRDVRSSKAWLGLGYLLSLQGKETEALQAYHAALDLAPKDPCIWNEIGIVHFRLKAYDQAKRAFQQAINANPECGWFYANLALTLSHAGKDAEALPLYRRGMSLLTEAKQKALLLARIGDICQRLGEADTAQLAYRRAQEFGAQAEWFGQDLKADPYSLLHPSEDFSPTPTQASAPEIAAAVSSLSPTVETVLSENPSLDGEEAELACGAFAQAFPSDAVAALEPTPESYLEASDAAEEVLDRLEDYQEMACGAFAQSFQVDNTQPVPSDNAASLPPTVNVRREDLEEAEMRSAGENDRETWSLQEEEEGKAGDDATIHCPAEAPVPSEATDQDAPPTQAVSPEEWNARGHALLAAGLYDEAIQAYLTAIRLTPGGFHWPYIHNLTMAYQQRENLLDKLTSSAIGVSPTSEEQSVEEVGLASDLCDPSAMEETPEASQAPDLDKRETRSPVLPSSASAGEARHYRPSVASLHLMKEARQESPASARHSDRSVDAWVSASPVIFAVPSNLDESSRPILEEQDFVPRNAQEWNAVGNALLRVGAYDRAIAAYSRAIALSPQDGWPYNNLALAYYYKRRYAEAVPLYLKSIALLKHDKEKAIAWNRLGDAYRRMNDHERARMAYRRAAELDNRGSSLLQRARWILLGNPHKLEVA